MIKEARYLRAFAVLIILIFLSSCGDFKVTVDLEQGGKGSSTDPIQLATPVAMQPAAGICSEGAGEVVTMRVDPDVPDPRCLQIRPDQRLAVFNGLEVQLDISLGGFSATLEPGEEVTFEIPAGEFLLPGVHYLSTSSCCGGAIWLKGVGSEAPSGTTETFEAIETAFPQFQGYLEFPYIAADAGNFSLQAGEEITIIWKDAPFGAETYEITFIRSDDFEESLPMTSSLPAQGVKAQWLVPGGVSGRLEGFALFTDGQEVRSGCCAQVYTGELPPEGICSLRVHGIGVQNLYQEASDASARIAGIAPGLYLEVLGRTADGWYWVKSDSHIDSTSSENGNVIGWINGVENVGFHGPCEDIPLVD